MGPSRGDEVRNVAVLGHRGSGKTALVQAMLYVAGAAPRLGKPGAWAAGLDESPEEQAHLGSFELRCAALKWQGARVNLFDSPGDASFVAQARLALEAADAAILVVSAKDGVQSGTERAFRWIREKKLPCLVVLTDPDDGHARLDEVVGEIRRSLDAHADLMEVCDGERDAWHGVIEVERPAAWLAAETDKSHEASAQIPAQLREAVARARARLVDDAAAADDAMTERYLEKGDLSQEELDEAVRLAVARSQLLPLFIASPMKPTGVAALLDAVVHVLPPPADRAAEPLSLLVFKTTNDVHAGRAVWARVRSGRLQPDDTLAISGKPDVRERVTLMHQPIAGDLRSVNAASAGEVVVLPKLKSARTGDVLHAPGQAGPERPQMPPAIFSRALSVDSRGHEEKVAAALARLAEEDPGLTFTFDEQTRDLILSGHGLMHLEVTADRLRRRAGVEFKLGPPRIPYRETFLRAAMNVEGKQKKQSGGHGQFGVCHIDVEPLPRGAGFQFEDAIVGGVIPRQFIPSVQKGVERALARGVLAGYPVTDVKVRLVDGKTHSVDSSDAAFQVAGYRAFMAAAEQAHPVLLEPVMKLEVKVPAEALGDVIGDLNARHGRVLSTDTSDSRMVVTALVPLTHLLDYEPKLTALSRGHGSFSMSFDHYDAAPPALQEKIVSERGFKPAEE